MTNKYKEGDKVIMSNSTDGEIGTITLIDNNTCYVSFGNARYALHNSKISPVAERYDIIIFLPNGECQLIYKNETKLDCDVFLHKFRSPDSVSLSDSIHMSTSLEIGVKYARFYVDRPKVNPVSYMIIKHEVVNEPVE